MYEKFLGVWLTKHMYLYNLRYLRCGLGKGTDIKHHKSFVVPQYATAFGITCAMDTICGSLQYFGFFLVTR